MLRFNLVFCLVIVALLAVPSLAKRKDKHRRPCPPPRICDDCNGTTTLEPPIVELTTLPMPSNLSSVDLSSNEVESDEDSSEENSGHGHNHHHDHQGHGQGEGHDHEGQGHEHHGHGHGHHDHGGRGHDHHDDHHHRRGRCHRHCICPTEESRNETFMA